MRYINFNQLRSFHAVALTGNVTSASQLIGVSQPTVTTQLKQLEETYDVELLFRMHRGIRLTPTGRALYRLTMRIFALEEDALNLFADTQNLVAGELRAGAVGPYFSMRLLTLFNQGYPNVKISLTTGNSQDLLAMLLDFEIDIAILGNVAENPVLSRFLLSEQPVVLVVGQDHPWYGRESVGLDELDGTKVIYREQGSETRKVLEDALAERQINPHVVIEVHREAVREAALQGLGVGILSEPEFRPGEGLHKIAIDDATITTAAYLVCLKERADMRMIKAFIELL